MVCCVTLVVHFLKCDGSVNRVAVYIRQTIRLFVLDHKSDGFSLGLDMQPDVTSQNPWVESMR